MASSAQRKYQEQYDQFTGTNKAMQNSLQGRAGDYAQWGNTALQTYGDVLGAGIDPNAINRARATGEKGVADYSSMVSGLYNAPGYSADEQAHMRSAVTQPTSAAFRTAQSEAGRAGAASGNAGAAQANIGELAREKARTISPMLSGLYGQFGDARRQDVATAIQGQAAIPGMAGQQFQGEMANTSQLQFPVNALAQQSQAAVGAQLDASGQQLQATDMARQQANKPSFLKQLALAGMQGAAGSLTSGMPGMARRPQPSVGQTGG